MSEKERKQLLEQIEGLIESQDSETLKELLSESRSSDVAEVVEVLDEVARQILFDVLDPKEAGEVLEKIDEATRSEVVDDMTSDELIEIVETLPPDEAADVVGELDEQQAEEVLEQIDKEESDQIEKLMSYDEDTAGGIMTSVLVKVRLEDTISDALEQIRNADPDDEFFHVFVVGKNDILRGTVKVHTLLRRAPSTKIVDVLDEELPTVEVSADQEHIANTFRKNDLIVMPVVDSNGILLGRITVDDVVDVMEEEAEEDVLVMAGTRPEELDTHRALKAASIRLPWLLTCMLGALLSAIIFYPPFEKLFQDSFGVNVWHYIIYFIPAIAAMGGNSGMQTSTVVVRGLATGDLAALKLAQVFWREARVAFIVALACAIIAGIVAVGFLTMQSDDLIASSPKMDVEKLAMVLGVSVGISMFFAILLSTLLGLFLPYIFRRVGVDPAVSSGPLVTTANDIVSFVTYFSLTFFLLKLYSGVSG